MQRPRKIAMVVQKFKTGKDPRDIEFWMTQTPQARLEAVGEIRREHHGWTYETEPRLQRVFSIVKQ